MTDPTPLSRQPLTPDDVLGITGERVPFPEMKARLLRACRTLRAMPDPTRKFQTLHNSWPDVVREVSESYGYTEERVPRFRPSPADVTDYLIALEWCRGLDKREFRLVWAMSYGISYHAIGLRLASDRGRPYSETRTREMCREVLLKCWANANA
jgi:hypothetical protein